MHALEVPADDALVTTVVRHQRHLGIPVSLTIARERHRFARFQPVFDFVIKLTNQLVIQINCSGPHAEFLLGVR